MFATAIALFLTCCTANAAASARWADSTDGVHTFLTFDSHIPLANITAATMKPVIMILHEITRYHQSVCFCEDILIAVAFA